MGIALVFVNVAVIVKTPAVDPKGSRGTCFDESNEVFTFVRATRLLTMGAATVRVSVP